MYLISHNNPNPFEYVIATFSFSLRVFLFLYSGNNRLLKQVWAVGSL